jgi:hypothetical protein
MKSLIDWCNQNQGFLIAVLTFVSVTVAIVSLIITVAMACIMACANRLSSKNIALTSKIAEEQSRPYVMFDIQIKGFYIYAILKNFGATPAHDVTISLNPELKNLFLKPVATCKLTAQPFGYLLPGRELVETVATISGQDFSNLYPKLKFDGKVTYHDTRGQKYDEPFVINFASPNGTLINFTGEEEIRNELREIKDVLQNLGLNLKAR